MNEKNHEDSIEIRTLSEEEIDEAKKNYEENGFFIVKKILTPTHIEWFNQNIKFIKDSNKEPSQFYRQHAEHHPLFDELHNKLTPLVNQVLSNNNTYYRTYNFGMMYLRGSKLLPHLDLITNELSSTFVFNTNEPYPLFIDSRYVNNQYDERFTIHISRIPNKFKKIIDIDVGDIAFFNGRNHFHFRQALFKNVNYKSILFHWSTCIEYPYSKAANHKNKIQFVRNLGYYKKQTSKKVPYLNSVIGPHYQ